MKNFWKVTKQWAFMVFAYALLCAALITMPIWGWIKGSRKTAYRVIEWFEEKGEGLGLYIS